MDRDELGVNNPGPSGPGQSQEITKISLAPPTNRSIFLRGSIKAISTNLLERQGI